MPHHQQLPASSQTVGGVFMVSKMEKLLAEQQQQLDDITSESSFLEFLQNEQSCLASVISGGAGTAVTEDADVDSIFEQVSKLAGAGQGSRSVDEILREAEQLIQRQPVFTGKEVVGEHCAGNVEQAPRGFRDISCESTPMEMKSGLLEELEVIASTEMKSQQLSKVFHKHENGQEDDGENEEPPVRDCSRRKSFTVCSNSKEDNNEPDRRPNCDQTYILPVSPAVEMRNKRPTSAVAGRVPANLSSTGGGRSSNSTTPKKRNSVSKGGGRTDHQPSNSPRKSEEENKENQLLTQARIRDLEEIYNLTLKESIHEKKIPSPGAAATIIVREKTFCDKSTAPSPTHSTSPGNSASFGWAKERELECSISELQEKLKDTEERYESLKIQYDTLSQVHRTLRDNYGAVQEESDKLKLDVQHLTECANVLRSELQSARSDRDAAVELQKILQSELEESRREKKRYQELNEKDTKTIQDLQRQCREMERILMRKHPDSVSALIVASKNTSNSKPASEDASQTRRLLEQRIAQLEADAKEQDAKAQGILANVQARFNSVQAKYETHIADLEMQVLSLQEINSKLNEKIIRQMEELSSITSHAAASMPPRYAHVACSSSFTQTEEPLERERTKTRSISVQTDSKLTGGRFQPGAGPKRASSASVSGKLPTSLSDSHIQNREDAHLLATIRGMRVDLAIKEKAVQRLTREVEDCKKTIRKLQKERDACLKPDGKPSNSSASSMAIGNKGKAYDPSQFADNGVEPSALKDANLKIKLLEADYKTLHEKRLQDLKTLQAAHERELAACHETVRIMQQRLADREEHLHTSKEKRRPNHNVDYYALKAKVSSLERRHTEREQRLHLLVDALSKGGKLNGVHIRQLASASAAALNGANNGLGDEENHNLANAIDMVHHQQQNATVGGNL